MIPHYFDMIRARRERFWWFAGRRDLFVRLLGPYSLSRIKVGVDIGCGPAANESIYSLLAERWVSADLSAASFNGWPPQKNQWRIVADASKLPIREAAVSLALLLDIVEHLPDERPVLDEARRVLVPGGLLLVSVPAFNLLWSWHDEQAGHYRRYRLRQLKQLAESKGFDVLEACYYNFALAIPIFLARKFFRMMPFMTKKTESDLSPGFLNGLLCFWLRIENTISTAGVPLPFGTSAVLLLQKRGLEGDGNNRR